MSEAPLPDDRQRAQPLKGRGSATRLAHRFQQEAREAHDDGWGSLGEGADTLSVPPETVVTPETVKSILARNDSPDLPFTWSINPYRGCEHGCIYCYARPTHSYLNLSPGLDFETRLIAKVNAADCLRRELQKKSHEVSPINVGSATDPYQPVERTCRITRSVLEVLTATGHPFSIVTKSSGVERDLDLLAPAAARQQALVLISITTLDADLSRRLEPRGAAPHRITSIRLLDLDTVGAHERQLVGAIGTRHDPGQVHHLDAMHCLHFDSS